jgi:hypothetical protein
MQTTLRSEGGFDLDVTDCLSPYREAVRHLWNTLFANSDLASFDSVDTFAEIADRLFDAVVVPLIVARAGPASDGAQRGSLRVVPSMPDGVPIMIENPREGDRNCYWDHPITQIRPEGVDLRYVGYFDWDSLGSRDYRYYLVEIVRFLAHPELERRRALVEVGHASIMAQTRPTEKVGTQ